jgi:ribose transport system ATP-binding protein
MNPGTNSNIVLEMKGITKSFPGVLALDGVDLNVREGEVHVLLGENGAGKSTLINILGGIYQANSGEIYLDGHRVSIKSTRQSHEAGISVIHQELALVPQLTVAENIFLGREPLRGWPGLLDLKKTYQQTLKLFERLQLDLRPERLAADLSVAEQQMVEIAKALSFGSKIIVMDEPTSALTHREIEQLFRIIRELTGQGMSVIYISHRMDEIAQIGTTITVLRDGRRIGTVKVGEVDVDVLIRMIVGRELSEKFPPRRTEIGDVVLKVNSVSRTQILHNISFELHQGEILGVAGLVGAGRTELVRAIFGVDQIDNGEIEISGQKVRIASAEQAKKLGLALLPEDRKSQGIVGCLSVKENISLAALERFSTRGVLNLKREAEAAQLYKSRLRIKTPHLNTEIASLSGGNQQKVILARWLATRAKIFIFDEPTRGIDVGAKTEIYQLMNELVAQGVAILMVSSELPEIMGMSDRVLVMRRGEIVGVFDKTEMTDERILNAAFYGGSKELLAGLH